MIRIGFIGCGGIANEYQARLDERPERAVVAAYCDIDGERARAFAETRGASAYTDWRRMLDQARLDAVFCNLPPFARGEELVAVAEAGCAIFSTKPLGLEMEGPRRTLAAIERAGVINSVGYMFRYSGVTEEVVRRLEGRTPALLVGQVYGGMPGGWTARTAMSGGQLVEQSTHIFDLLRMLGGEATEAFAGGHSGAGGDIDYPDSTAVTLALDSGAVGTVLSTTAVRKFFWGLTVIAPDLHLDVVYDDWTVRGVDRGERVDLHIPVAGYQEQVDAFLHAVESGDRSGIRSSYRDGCGTLAATLAANRSLDTGRPEPVERL